MSDIPVGQWVQIADHPDVRARIHSAVGESQVRVLDVMGRTVVLDRAHIAALDDRLP